MSFFPCSKPYIISSVLCSRDLGSCDFQKSKKGLSLSPTVLGVIHFFCHWSVFRPSVTLGSTTAGLFFLTPLERPRSIFTEVSSWPGQRSCGQAEVFNLSSHFFSLTSLPIFIICVHFLSLSISLSALYLLSFMIIYLSFPPLSLSFSAPDLMR